MILFKVNLHFGSDGAVETPIKSICAKLIFGDDGTLVRLSFRYERMAFRYGTVVENIFENPLKPLKGREKKKGSIAY